MTREEAIRIIKEGLCYLRCANGCNMDECKANCEYKEVVEVLDQEPKIYINGDMSAKILEYFKDINYAYNDCTRYDTLKRMIDELQEPKSIQEKQAESEKYQKAFDDGYANGYSQARFDFEVKTGHWIDTDEGFSPCKCSECGAVEFKRSKYCPNCGAKME